jgi:hypothetical protein
MASSQHPAATLHLPGFITAPGQTDVLMVVMAVILLLAIFGFGILFFRLHSLPERIAHKSQRLQFEIVAVLGLISLFTHMHIFWVIGLLLALIEFPDFGTPLGRIARSTEKIAGLEAQPASPIAPLGPHEEAYERDQAASLAASLGNSGKTDQRENGVSPAAVPARPREVDHA